MTANEFKQRFLPLQALLFTVARRYMGNDDDAKDVLQEAMLKLWTMRGKLSTVNDDKAFCSTLVRNMCIDFLRRKAAPGSETPVEKIQLASGVSASQDIERQQTATIINRCLQALPPRQQQVLTLRDINGCSMEEIERATGLNAVNIRVTLSRARNALKQMLKGISIN